MIDFLVSTQLTKGRMDEFMQKTAGSRKLFERAQGSLPSGSTRAPYYYSPYPLYIKKGEGPYVWDVDGNKYLDFANNMGPLVLGHRNPRVQKAIEAQTDAFWCGGPTELEVELAEKIKKAFPFGDHLLFTPSGTEATMKLIRAARASTGKDRIMLSTGAYHGSHDIVTTSPGIPKSYLSLVTRYSYNDEESFVKAFRKDKAELGAVVMEGLLGHAGSAPPTRSFIKTVREETEKAGVPFIIDEVVTGFRVARGGISEIMGVKPDGVTLGKIIGGGFPAGAFLATDRLMKEYQYTKADFPHIGRARLQQSGTFNAHAVTMAAGLATLEQLTPDAYKHLAWAGGEASRILDKLATERRIPHAMTGIGSIFFMHFSKDPINNAETAESSDERKGRILDALMLPYGVSMPAFHSAFASLPMGKPEMALFEKAVASGLDDMKKIGEL